MAQDFIYKFDLFFIFRKGAILARQVSYNQLGNCEESQMPWQLRHNRPLFDESSFWSENGVETHFLAE